jgi:HK97 gp10 family phage protein
MIITYELKGLSQLINKYQVKPNQALDQISKAMNLGCTKIMSDIRTMISVVGEPDGVPRRRTGELLRSIKVGKQKKSTTKIEQAVGANPDGEEEGYSIYLEYGTSRMKPRPYIAVGAEKNIEHMVNQLETAIKNIC